MPGPAGPFIMHSHASSRRPPRIRRRSNLRIRVRSARGGSGRARPRRARRSNSIGVQVAPSTRAYSTRVSRSLEPRGCPWHGPCTCRSVAHDASAIVPSRAHGRSLESKNRHASLRGSDSESESETPCSHAHGQVEESACKPFSLRAWTARGTLVDRGPLGPARATGPSMDGCIASPGEPIE